MADLPLGTVTFLFTDIEGSTLLVRELGDAYAAALAEHRRILRVAFARRSGSGGCGKTRFVIALGHGALAAYPDGVWWVPLAERSRRGR